MKNILIVVLVILLGIAFVQRKPKEIEKVKIIYDTVKVSNPTVKDCVIYKRVVTKLPIVIKDTVTMSDTIIDSVHVEIPMSRKVYKDSLYKAVVSGYNVSLDSIFIYNKTTFIYQENKPKRWGLGVSAGYAITPKGLQPYIGVGVTYNFKLWY